MRGVDCLKVFAQPNIDKLVIVGDTTAGLAQNCTTASLNVLRLAVVQFNNPIPRAAIWKHHDGVNVWPHHVNTNIEYIGGKV